MKASGSFTSSIQELINKAKKAMIPLYKTIMQFKIPFRNALNLFKTFVEPIILYNTENWSSMTAKNIDKCKLDPTALHNIALNSQTTACQLKFYKFILGVGRQTPNLAIFGEIAEIPLQLKAYTTVLKYWDRIRSLEDDTLVKKAYMENLKMNTRWCQTLQILNATLKLNTYDMRGALS